jgi:hypothetical protein
VDGQKASVNAQHHPRELHDNKGSPHTSGYGRARKLRKPVVVEQYNKYMGGVDRSNQLLSYYGFSHRTVKWWKRAAFHLIDMAIVNAYIMKTEQLTPCTHHL